MEDVDEYLLGAPPVTDESMSEVQRIGNHLVAMATTVKALEMELERAKKAYEYIEQIELPEAMDKIGMVGFRLASGESVYVEPFIKVTYFPDEIETVDKWLTKNGHPGLVKRQISISIPRGTNPIRLKPLLDWLNNKSHFDYNDKKSIHYQTLQAWAREMQREGEVIPENIFNVYQGRKATVSKE